MTSLSAMCPAIHHGSLSVPEPQTVLAAIELVSVLLRVPVESLDLAAPEFARIFPRDEVPDHARPVFKGELARYRAFRNVILDAQMIARPGDVDGSEWDSLRRAARLSNGTRAQPLYGLPKLLPPGTRPREISASLARDVEARLSPDQRQLFRRGIAVLDGLHDHALAVSTGLLPVQRVRSAEMSLPPRLERLIQSASEVHKTAVRFGWRLGLAAGVFRPGDDPDAQDLAAHWSTLKALDPGTIGITADLRIFETHMDWIARLLVREGLPDPRLSEIQGAWRHLRTKLRRPEERHAPLGKLAEVAIADDLKPSDLTPEWFGAKLEGLPRKDAKIFRHDCYRLDEDREASIVPADLLPRMPTGVNRVRIMGAVRTPEPKPVDPVQDAWTKLAAAARSEGFSNTEVGSLSPLRSRAKAAGLAPTQMTGPWFRDLAASQPPKIVHRLRSAVHQMNRFRAFVSLHHFLPEEDLLIALTPSRDEFTVTRDALLEELATVLVRRGSSDSTRKETEAALKALISSVGTAPDLRTLLDRDLEATDWTGYQERSHSYVLALGRIKAFLQLPWTEHWTRLQSLVVSAGVTPLENPIPKLLRLAGGRGPQELDAEWARSIDRDYRRISAQSPYGRADLARTFEGNIRRLDALHDIPELAVSGLLPRRIGNYRDG